MRDVYLWTGLAVTSGAGGWLLVLGYRRLVDWLDRRANPAVDEEPFDGPLYAPAFEPESEVLEGHVMVSDALGEWAPTEHEPLPALIADDIMHERAWLTLHCPPSWSAWTGSHPIVRFADLERFGAMA